jgi:hypothetical protein
MKLAKINYANTVVELLDLDSQPADNLDFYYIAPDSGLYSGDPVLGGSFDPREGLFSPKTSSVERVLVITSVVSSNHGQTVTSGDFSEVTCPVGTTLTFTCELRGAEGAILPVDSEFIAPIYKRASGNIVAQRLVKTLMTAGVVSISVPLPENGEWEVNESGINSRLPIERRMTFKGIKMFVYD